MLRRFGSPSIVLFLLFLVGCASTSGTTNVYEAESSLNTLIDLGGQIPSALRKTDTRNSAGEHVQRLGKDEWGNGALRFNNVRVSAAGRYTLELTYWNYTYNTPLTVSMTVNGRPATPVVIPVNKDRWPEVPWRTLQIPDVALDRGDNSITFGNTTGWCPDIDKLEVHGNRGAGLPALAPVTISPPGGQFSKAIAVTLSCATPGAEIRYQTDGGAVTKTSPLYTGPLTLSADTNLKVKVFKAGHHDSYARASFMVNRSATYEAEWAWNDVAGSPYANVSNGHEDQGRHYSQTEGAFFIPASGHIQFNDIYAPVSGKY